MRQVTLDDVAAMVGVSAKTVSRVVNSDTRVSPETRERVKAAVEKLGYRPNLAARSLATSRSHLIGTFAPATGLSHFFGELTHGAIRACRAHDYNLVVDEFDMRAPGVADIYKNGLRHLHCDGLILPSPVCDEMDLLDMLDEDEVRYVRISPAKEISRSPALISDHAAGARAVARHFWSLGHRRFGVLTGLPYQASSPMRRDGFIDGIIAAGGNLDDIMIIEMATFLNEIGSTKSGIDLGRQAGSRFLSSPNRPGAIFAYNDEFAAGIVIQARNLGISVPDELAVAGFDDSDAARLCWPPLTSVRQPISDIAAQAVAMLAKPDAWTRETVICPVELIIRGSTCRETGLS